MGLETATFIADLVTTNPPTSDLETQGANHIQLIKTVLQNVFGTSVRRLVGLPATFVATGGLTFNLGATNNTVLTSTALGPVTFTLPTGLGALDAGWECSILKTTTDLNPIFLVPPSGTIQSGEYSGLAKVRRCIPGRRTRVLWTGSTFICERVESRPIGTVFDSMFAALPVGYEWANGQILSSAANYPEFFAINGNTGNTPDARNRASFGLDNPGGTGASGRITIAGQNFDGTVVNGTGGLQNHAMTAAELVSHLHPSPTLTDPQHVHPITDTSGAGGTVTGSTGSIRNPGGSNGGTFTTLGVGAASTGITLGPNTGPQGGSTPFTVLPPAIIFAKILVVE